MSKYQIGPNAFLTEHTTNKLLDRVIAEFDDIITSEQATDFLRQNRAYEVISYFPDMPEIGTLVTDHISCHMYWLGYRDFHTSELVELYQLVPDEHGVIYTVDIPHE